MKTLVNKKIIYDDTCPMCQWYTGQFIASGVLAEGDRLSFSQLSDEYKNRLDLNRARHEIPLMDTQTGEVLYGLDGLMLIIGKVFPLLNNILNSRVYKLIIRPLYKFISYNRRIIIPAEHKNGFDAAPDFHLGWRIAFIIFMLFASWGIYQFYALDLIGNLALSNNYFIFLYSFFGINLTLIVIVAMKVDTFPQKLNCIATLMVAFFLGIIFGTVCNILIINVLKTNNAYLMMLSIVVFQVIFLKESERRIRLNNFLK